MKRFTVRQTYKTYINLYYNLYRFIKKNKINNFLVQSIKKKKVLKNKRRWKTILLVRIRVPIEIKYYKTIDYVRISL